VGLLTEGEAPLARKEGATGVLLGVGARAAAEVVAAAASGVGVAALRRSSSPPPPCGDESGDDSDGAPAAPAPGAGGGNRLAHALAASRARSAANTAWILRRRRSFRGGQVSATGKGGREEGKSFGGMFFLLSLDDRLKKKETETDEASVGRGDSFFVGMQRSFRTLRKLRSGVANSLSLARWP